MEVVTIVPAPAKAVINVTQSIFLKEYINCNKNI
jgi:hypothetical protein